MFKEISKARQEEDTKFNLVLTATVLVFGLYIAVMVNYAFVTQTVIREVIK